MTALARRQRNRMERERRILAAALEVFSRTGYSGATMDAVAAGAGLSKPTLYQYFQSKEALFSAMLLDERDHMLAGFEQPSENGMVADLLDFAWAYAGTVLRPDMLSLARLIIGEVQRFPEIGHAYQAAGPDRLLKGIMGYLQARAEEGRLRFADAELAAQDLWGLILSAPRTQALHMPDRHPTRTQVARYVHNGLRIFLTAYSTAPDADVAELERLLEARRDSEETQ